MREAGRRGGMPAPEELLLARITVDRAPDLVLWFGADARILYGNEAACRRLGYSREELLALRITELDPDFPEADISRRWAELVAQGSRTFEARLRAADGTLIPVEVTCHHVAHGGWELGVSLVRDLTGRREAEERLRESEERFREMAELLPEGVFEAGLDLTLTYANRRALELFGFTREDLRRGLKGLEVLSPEDRPRALENLGKRLRGEDPGAVEYTGVRRDGSTFPVLLHAGLIVREGAPAGVRGVIVDLTESKRVEEEVRASAARVQRLVEASPVGTLFCRLEEDGRLVFTGANPAANRLLGVDTDAFVGKTIEEAFPGLAATEVPERYREAAARGTPWQTDQLVYDDGRVAGAYEVVAFQTAPGEMAALFLEITERKRAEEEMKRSEATPRSIFRVAPAGIGLARDRILLEVNDEVCEMVGRSREELLGRNARILYPTDEDYEYVGREKYHQIREQGTGTAETRWQHRDGRVLHVLLSSTPIDAADLQKGITFTALDITENKEAVEALRESEERFRRVVEESNDAIYILFQERFDLVNRRFCELMGVTPEEAAAPGFSIWSTVDPESLPLIRERQERRARGEKIPGVYDFVIRSRDGRRVRVEASVTEIDYRGGKAVLGILRDNTEREKLEEQLRQAQKLESIGRLSGGVAHDLNNLLSPILGYGEMLLEDFGKGDRRREMAGEIVSAATRARALIRQLLAFSRKQTLEFRPVDLNSLVTNFHRLLRRTIREDIRVELALAPGLPVIQADLGQVEQVIMNLAVNAEDAMPHGGRLTIETAFAGLDQAFAAGRPGVRPGRYVLLAMSDTGVGMDPRTMELVFEPFFTTKEKGTGLGLATVYGIVKQHGGNIWVYSEPGRGTTFKCYFPVLEGEEILPDHLPVSEEGVMGGTEVVMVVEDDAAVRGMAEAVLKRQGHTVLSAADGKECLALLDQHEGPLELVLTDVVLPGMNGRALVEEIRTRFPGVRALFMSGYTGDVITKHGVLEEGIAFIQKPFTVRRLAARVREVLREE